jgi:hypothetical protein
MWLELPVPSRRTFAAAILAFAHSEETSLRLRGCARFPTPLDWRGQLIHPMKIPKFCDRAVRYSVNCMLGCRTA